MSPFASHSTGPTFTAASARLSLSGLDHFGPLVDPNILDTADWYQSTGQDHYHPPLSPGPDQFPVSPTFGASFGDVSHGVAASGDLRGPQYSTLNLPMNGHIALQHDRGGHISHLDDLVLSPLQTAYPPNPNVYQTPYPDSTASSAPSEDPIIVEADEDKRKRNQAASARFRQKKKQREQHMLEQSRDMHDKTRRLEGEVENLKRENTFLKKLLVEKVDNMNEEDRQLLVKTTKATRDVSRG